MPLVLDPAVLVYAGYIGGSGDDRGNGIAVDGSGNAYITGFTNSSESTFPVTAGPDLTYNGVRDAFVAKVVNIPVLPENLELVGSDSGLIGSTYHFTATTAPISTTIPITYVWQATGQTPVTRIVGLTDAISFEWDISGQKHITVTVNNDFGAITSTHAITLYTPVHADFIGDPIGGHAPRNVTFTNMSTGDYDTCTWDFGDGGGSNDCQPGDYVYRFPGVYNVTLAVTGPGGTDEMIKGKYIDVHYGLYLPAVLKPET